MGFQGAIVTSTNLIVNLNNKVYNAQSDHPNFSRLKEAFKARDEKAFLDAFDVKKAIQTYVDDGEEQNSGITVEGDQVFYNGKPVHNSVVTVIQNMMSDGFDIKPLVKFLENLMKCPSYNSQKELWDFVEEMGLTVTEDGCFLAYKTVRSDYTDKYTGTIDNEPGQKPPRLERHEVDDNCNHACSHGYHVGALGYAGPGGWYNHPGDKVIICKVNPQDVVSVPRDCACQKLRCCYYEPVGEFQGELKQSVYSGQVGDDYSSSSTPEQKFVSGRVDPYSLLEDNYYIGDYTSMDGRTNVRYFLVEEEQADHYIVMLVEPETHAYSYRNFKKARLSMVQTWDGESNPDDLKNPYYDDLDDDDCEEYCCDDCGESEGECCCDDGENYHPRPTFW